IELSVTRGEHEISLFLKVDGARGVATFEDPSLVSGDVWVVTCADEELWCQGKWRVGDTSTSLEVIPAGHVEGVFQGNSAPPGRVALQAWAALEGAADISFSREIPLEDRRFVAKVPAIPLDLRLALEGWAPTYVWALEPRRGEKILIGPLPLRAGASLCAFVVEETGLPAVGAEVSLAPPPSEPGISADALRRLGHMRWTATTNDRGFFQIVGASEGEYELEIAPAGPLGLESAQSVLRIDAVALTSSAETCLADIVLPAGVTASFRVTPPTDPDGAPWTLTLAETTASTSAPIRGEFDLLGALAVEVPEGRYTAQLATSSGLRLDRRDLEIGGPVDVA
ncbi:MAG: hypothetical protein AAFX50_26585, partial [Acidobacteriota bacterium]